MGVNVFSMYQAAAMMRKKKEKTVVENNPEIHICMKNQDIVVDHNNTDNCDFVKAAYVLLRICDDKNLIDEVNKTLESENINLCIKERR